MKESGSGVESLRRCVSITPRIALSLNIAMTLGGWGREGVIGHQARGGVLMLFVMSKRACFQNGTHSEFSDRLQILGCSFHIKQVVKLPQSGHKQPEKADEAERN